MRFTIKGGLQSRAANNRVNTVITPPGPWTNSGPLSRGCRLYPKNLFRHSFLGHSGREQARAAQKSWIVKNTLNTVKIFRVNSVSRASASC